MRGTGTSGKLGSKVFGNSGVTPDDIAYQRYWDEVASGNHLPPGMTAEEYTKYLDGLGKVDAAIALNRVDYGEIIKLRKGSEGAGGDELPPLENAPYIKNGKPNGRPGPTGDAKLEFEQKVYDAQVDADGILREPYPPYDVIDWKSKKRGCRFWSRERFRV